MHNFKQDKSHSIYDVECKNKIMNNIKVFQNIFTPPFLQHKKGQKAHHGYEEGVY